MRRQMEEVSLCSSDRPRSLTRFRSRNSAVAATVVALGALTAPALGWLLGIDPAAVLGLLSGATTNTPSLGAAQQTLTTLPGVAPDRHELPALAYAVTYPVAIAGIIGTLLALKGLFRIDPLKEAKAFAAEQRRGAEPLERRTLIVENPNLEGVEVEAIPGRRETGVTVSRIRRAGEAEVHLAAGGTVLKNGDRIVAVGTGAMLDRFQQVVGRRSDEDLRLRFGDVLQVVGSQESTQQAAVFLGNSLKELNETHFIPLFIGIALGIALGTVPVAVPGLPQPLRLGLAGGALIVALALGRVGRIGRLVWHMPANVNLAFREFGIGLFLATVGLMAGARFFSTVFSPVGALWLCVGLFVTVPPLLVVGAFARGVLKLNFMALCGLLAGSMTDPPALAFASNISRSDVPTVSYATVYPLTMVLRILSAQILVLLLCG